MADIETLKAAWEAAILASQEAQSKERKARYAYGEALIARHRFKVGDVIEADGEQFKITNFYFTGTHIDISGVKRKKNGDWSSRSQILFFPEDRAVLIEAAP